MKLIIGLGNPGEKYKFNRHNVGHMLIDSLEKLPSGIIAKKTSVYMNDSGEEVKKLIKNYKLQVKNLYVIHDDLDLPLGKYKIQFGKGPKVHNGVNSIEQELDTPEFWRIRIGVDNRDPNKREIGQKYVLSDFTNEEKSLLTQVFKEIAEELIPKLS